MSEPVTKEEFEVLRKSLEETLKLLVRSSFWGTSQMDPASKILNRLSLLKSEKPATPSQP